MRGSISEAATRIANISVCDSVVASPEPKRPSAGMPNLPKISASLATTLKPAAMTAAISVGRGRSSAEKMERPAKNSSVGARPH